MDTKTTLSISQARARIFDLADQVQKPGRVYTFTDKGMPKAVMLSAEKYESLLETIEVMRIFPNLDKDIAQVRRDIKSGAYKKYTTLEQLLAKDNALHPNNKTKSRKALRKNS